LATSARLTTATNRATYLMNRRLRTIDALAAGAMPPRRAASPPLDEMPLDLFMGKTVCFDLRQIPDLGDITATHMEEEEEKKVGVDVNGHILCTGFYKRTYPDARFGVEEPAADGRGDAVDV
jgi:hypothetical protein